MRSGLAQPQQGSRRPFVRLKISVRIRLYNDCLLILCQAVSVQGLGEKLRMALHSRKIDTIAILRATMHSLTTPIKPVEQSSLPLLFPFLDLKSEYALMKAEIRIAVETVLESQ